MPQAVWDSNHPAGWVSDAGATADGTVPDDAGSNRADPDGAAADTGSPARRACLQALAEPLPARIAVLSTSRSGDGTVASRVVPVSEISDKIQAHCLPCHAGPTGGFAVATPSDLAKAATPLYSGGPTYATAGAWALAHIMGDGTTPNSAALPCLSVESCEAMPPIDPVSSPEGMAWTKRLQTGPGSDIVLLANELQAWIAAGTPATSFPLPGGTTGADGGAGAGDDGGGAASPYLMAPAVGNGLTNLGNCVPDPALVASDPASMDDLDAKFAGLQQAKAGSGAAASEIIGLPKNLEDTDLTTFDGATLASTGVIAFVPQYPLWSEDAGKIRYVRVPRGQSIRFHKDTQEFEIPPNTRFYKTFLKQIVDSDGNPSWRKIETRLIVSRPDTTGPDGTAQVNALYGAYRWNDEETEAVLNDNLLNEGDGFTDDVFEYETDLNTHATRHYAMPSSTRCVQCHQGSSSASFVLGFRPVQVVHRPIGEGGVIEASGYDEMTQLRRLIAYGIITGVDSPSDILPLEASEGDRTPRNVQELLAQGYMLGNCAHCHNPRGYPSVQFPVLRDVLSFLPPPAGGPSGGIFQFPLEKFSPRITRGIGGDVSIPYVTPSLLDHPSHSPDLDPNLGSPDLRAPVWIPKWLSPDKARAGPEGTEGFVYAPWRSLIYRNVDTPFAYADDFALYPHMPMNTAGYDPRAKRILGDWMVSIPAVRKRPDIDEYVQPYPDPGVGGVLASPLTWPNVGDDNLQPYVEVPPGAPGYDSAVLAARQRLAVFHSGTRPGEHLDPSVPYPGRYAYVPDTSDIVDPQVDPTCNPVPLEHETPLINVPTHPHWVILDRTQGVGPWTPRRQDWSSVLVGGKIVGSNGKCSEQGTLPAAKDADQQHVVDLLLGQSQDADGGASGVPGVTLDDAFRAFALTEVPMGLWAAKAQCDWTKAPLSSQPTLDQARASSHRSWMDQWAAADGGRHVYTQSPGAAVFDMICINCHGPNADSKGRLADNLATMTGGRANVADLRDGLFGPQASPGANRSNVFLSAVQAKGGTVDDWAARYVAWMALGGTQVTIPPSFLTIIGHTQVFGENRGGLAVPTSANMLTTARQLCMETLFSAPHKVEGNIGYFGVRQSKNVLWDNGDAELWLRLCSANNPPPVVPYYYQPGTPPGVFPAAWGVDISSSSFPNSLDPITSSRLPVVLKRDVWADPSCQSQSCASPPCCPVGDENGNVVPGLTGPDDPTHPNLHPWCIADGSAGGPACPSGGRLPYPAKYGDPSRFTYDPALGWDDPTADYARAWALRGAMNAGLAVFLYLDAVARHEVSVKPAYDACEELQGATGDGGAN
jgi:mono/diheme cytochrome c family protein